MPDVKNKLSLDALDKVVSDYKNGDEKCFAILYDETHHGVITTIYSYIKNYSEIIDLVQDTYVQVHVKIDQYNIGTNFRAWVNTIARNLTINYLRKHNKELAFSEIDEDKLPTYELTYEIDKRLEAVLNNLDDEQRELYKCLILEGMSVKDTATKMNLSLNRVYYLKSLMETNVKKILKDY